MTLGKDVIPGKVLCDLSQLSDSVGEILHCITLAWQAPLFGQAFIFDSVNSSL